MSGIDVDKGYPSKISVVYPEGSLKQKLATFSFNQLSMYFDANPELASNLAEEFGVTESELYHALEELYTEN